MRCKMAEAIRGYYYKVTSTLPFHTDSIELKPENYMIYWIATVLDFVFSSVPF